MTTHLRVSAHPAPITAAAPDGRADAAFAPVADAFKENFRRRGESGAAVCVYHRGRTVVDLWGGMRDARRRAPWAAGTLVPVLSVTKGLVAACCAVAVARGHFAYDDPVGRHWPDFAQSGKEAITVRDLLTHRAGLAPLDRRLTLADLADRDRLAALLARQRPVWPPGRRAGYHLATIGLYLDQLMRRTDPRGRGCRDFFADEIARPLGLAVHIGVPDDVPAERLALLRRPRARDVLAGVGRLPRGLGRQALNPFSLLHRSLRVLKGYALNDRAWLGVECASVNGAAEARGIARLYAALAAGGGALGLTRPVFDALCAAPAPPPGGAADLVMGARLCWGLGFMKPSAAFRFSDSDRAFGMPGFGGAFAFCDPDRALAYAYTPARLGVLPFNDPRERALRDAMWRCVAND